MDQKALEYTRSHYDKHSNQVRRNVAVYPSPPAPPCRCHFADRVCALSLLRSMPPPRRP